ncbi:hypothetical protein NEMBOFW57_004290 [Staphylotrichum longicolle]|uniref:Metallo-beta-lactamase domain-containing protein n=1 Tax=Staphylotrichum longicolle TaxID=669026 RepID=A0AAD4F7D2_9PEZI|nr:hypothetical protein NEMBOFW57_004290 [Staphylotrichum longicolle]
MNHSQDARGGRLGVVYHNTNQAQGHGGSRYRVDNWQIPVPIGDASAHFLLKVGNGPNPEVVQSFFMDGGDDAQHGRGEDTASKKIAQALAVMNEAYSTTNWTFDAIVTTHHDRDHYYGLSQLLGQTVTRNDGEAGRTYQQAYFRPDLTYYRGNNDNPGAPFPKWHPICPCTIAGEEAIGIDLFSRTRMFYRHRDTFMAQSAMDKKHGVIAFNHSEPDIVRRPRFVVVGRNGYGVSVDSADRITVNDPTENQKSLLAVLYWPQTGHTSYFTGGDGNPKVELKGVVPWMLANEHKNYLPRLPVKMVKLDHHGSLNETLNDKDVGGFDKTILTMMQPKSVLVTPGNKHGHPNWVVMELVRRHLATTGGKLYTTRSPYWLSKGRTNMLDTNTNHASYKKVAPMFAPGKGDWDDKIGGDADDDLVDDPHTTNGTLMMENMHDWKGDYDDYKVHDGDFATELMSGPDFDQYIKDDGKPNRKAINEEKKKRAKQVLLALKNSHRLTVKDKSNLEKRAAQEEEVDESELQVAHRVTQDNRDNLRWQHRQVWEQICEQEICDRGSPYFLVRFSFEQGEDPVVDCDMDEAGKPKPLQSAVPDTQKKVHKTIGEYDMVDDRGHDVNITTVSTAKSTAEYMYEHAEGLETLTARLSFMNYELNLGLGQHFSNLNFFPQKKSTKQLLPAGLAGIGAMPGNSMDNAKNIRIKLPDFSKTKVKDATNQDTAKPFTGGWPELLSFTAFVKQTCQNYKDVLEYTTPNGIKWKKGRGRAKNGYEEATDMLWKMYQQWIVLQDAVEKAATGQYATHVSQQFRRLKLARIYVRPTPHREDLEELD